MAKTIRKMIRISTRRRKDGMKFNDEFYSYDRNNAKFEFLMEEDVPAEKVIALFHFEKTNRYYETVCSVQGNLITIDFDTSLIVEDENVSGYLYFNKLEQSTDVYRFNFGVVVSEIDKTRYLPEEAITLRQLFLTEIATKKEVAALIEGLKNEMSKLTGGDISQLVTKEELDNKHYLTNHQSLEEYAKKTELYNDEALRIKISAIEERFNNLSNIYLTSHQSLDHLATKQELNAVETRVQQLENKAPVDVSNLATKEELEQLRSNQPQVDHSNLVTKDELEGKHYLTEHQPLTDYAKRTELENLVTKQELTEKNYLTAHQSLDEYAKKSELYNDSALTERVNLLEAKAIANGAYNDKPLLDKIHAIEEKSNQYLTSHQSLEHLVTKDELAGKGYLTTHQDISGLVTKQELEEKHYIQDVSNLATTEKVTAVENRVQTLENKSIVTHEELESKHYLVEHQSLEGLVTKEELASKNYLTNHQPLDSYVTKSELEQAGYLKEHQSLSDYARITDLSDLATNSKVESVENRVLALENKPTIDTSTFATKGEIPQAYNDEEVKRRLTTLEGKTDNFITGVSVSKEGSNVTLTYNYVDGQTKNVSFTDSDTVNVAYDDSGLKQRITNLENRPQVDTTILVSKAELPNLIPHQSLENYALKSELYNDTALTQRISNLENSTVTKQELQSKNYLTEHQSLTDYAKKSEIPNTSTFATVDSVNNLLRTQGEQATKITALENKTGYEIHGTGMPNGRVSAPIGTTYVDTAVTNGALKWIKETGNGNTGWKVLIGDTGWRTLKSVSRAGNSFIKIRRVNNLVTYQFGGLQWGWFGVGRRNGPGYMGHGSSGDRGAKVLPIGGIPEGFRSEASLVGPTFNDGGRPYGVWYLGGQSDSNYIQFTFNENIPTDRDIGDIRVSAVSYITDEDWPTVLP